MQSRIQPQGGRVGQAVMTKAPLYLVPGKQGGANGVSAIFSSWPSMPLCQFPSSNPLLHLGEAIQRNWLVALWDVI